MTTHFTQWLNDNCTSSDFGYGIHRRAARMTLNSGLSLSIQASDGHYCSPQETTEIPNYAWYTSFEVGFPSEAIEELRVYAEDDSDLTGTVYAQVPKKLLEVIIKANGGVKE